MTYDEILGLALQSLPRSANQRARELADVGAILADEKIGCLLEIGSEFGGSMWFWSQFAEPDATLLSIDIDTGQFRDDNRPSQGLIQIQADSLDPVAISSTVIDLASASVDFLFIDANHDYEHARSDFDTFSPLVRKNGLVGFHDIIYCTGVRQTFDEVKADRWHEEIVDWEDPAGAVGIGLVRM